MLNLSVAKNTAWASLKRSLINYVVSAPRSHILYMSLQPADVKLGFYLLRSPAKAAVKTNFRLMLVFISVQTMLSLPPSCISALSCMEFLFWLVPWQESSLSPSVTSTEPFRAKSFFDTSRYTTTEWNGAVAARVVIVLWQRWAATVGMVLRQEGTYPRQELTL